MVVAAVKHEFGVPRALKKFRAIIPQRAATTTRVIHNSSAISATNYSSHTPAVRLRASHASVVVVEVVFMMPRARKLRVAFTRTVARGLERTRTLCQAAA